MTIKANRRYLVTPDLQIPLHHPKAVSNLIKMARHEKFDFVLNVGDEMDLGSQSRWAKGTKLEFAETPNYNNQVIDRKPEGNKIKFDSLDPTLLKNEIPSDRSNQRLISPKKLRTSDRIVSPE